MKIEEIGVGELKDMIQEWIDWDYQHIREVPQYLRNRWLRCITFIIDEVRDHRLKNPKVEEIARPSEEASIAS